VVSQPFNDTAGGEGGPKFWEGGGETVRVWADSTTQGSLLPTSPLSLSLLSRGQEITSPQQIQQGTRGRVLSAVAVGTSGAYTLPDPMGETGWLWPRVKEGGVS
jgi:hypothetical protein